MFPGICSQSAENNACACIMQPKSYSCDIPNAATPTFVSKGHTVKNQCHSTSSIAAMVSRVFQVHFVVALSHHSRCTYSSGKTGSRRVCRCLSRCSHCLCMPSKWPRPTTPTTRPSSFLRDLTMYCRKAQPWLENKPEQMLCWLQ